MDTKIFYFLGHGFRSGNGKFRIYKTHEVVGQKEAWGRKEIVHTFGRRVYVRKELFPDRENGKGSPSLTLGEKKCKVTPTQQGSYLGFEIDTQKMEFKAPAEKIDQHNLR